MSNSEPTSSAEAASGSPLDATLATTIGQEYCYLDRQSSSSLLFVQLSSSSFSSPCSSSTPTTATCTSQPLQQQQQHNLLLNLIAASTTQTQQHTTASSAPMLHSEYPLLHERSAFSSNPAVAAAINPAASLSSNAINQYVGLGVGMNAGANNLQNMQLPSLISSIKEKELEVAECLAHWRNQSLQNAAANLNPNASSFFSSLALPSSLNTSNKILHLPTPSPDPLADQLRALQQLQLAAQIHNHQQLASSSSNSSNQMQSTSMTFPVSSSELLNSQLLQALVQKLQQQQQSSASSQMPLLGAQPNCTAPSSAPIQLPTVRGMSRNPAPATTTTAEHQQQQQQLLLQVLAASKTNKSLAGVSPVQPKPLNMAAIGSDGQQQKLGEGSPGRKYSKQKTIAPLKKKPPHNVDSDGEEDLIVHDKQLLQRQQQQVNRARAELKKGQTESGQAIRLPYSSESCHTITKFLMNFNLSADVQFSKKAIESLIKRLRDKRDELDFFIRAVHDGGVPNNANSPCVTIPRTLDGRLQVAGRKGFPHVVYSRIFRWPELHKNEIKHLPQCKAAFDMKCDSVCVNPFHYQRTAAPPSPQVELDVSAHPLYADGAPPKQHSPLHIDFMNTSASSSSASYIQKMIEQHKVSSLQLPVNSETHRKQSANPTVDMTLSLSSSAQSKQWLADFSSALAMVQPATQNAMAVDHLAGGQDLKNQQLAKSQIPVPLQLSPGIAEKLSQLNYDTQASEQSKKQAIVIGGKAFLDSMNELDMDSLIHHFCDTLRHELQLASKNHRDDPEDMLQIVEDEGSPQKQSIDTPLPELAKFMQQFPLSITALVRLLNESNSNSSTPCSDRQGRCSPAPRQDSLQHSTLTDQKTEGTEQLDLGKKKRPHNDSNTTTDGPAIKRRQLSGSLSSGGMTTSELLDMVSHVNTNNPHFPAIIQDILAEMDHMQRDDKRNLFDWRQELLKPLKSVLSVCLENGTKKAMNRLVEAIFQNINSKKSIPLMDAFREDTPIYTIGYNEFKEPVHKQSQFFNPLVYCGAQSMNSEQKEHFELGTSKLSPLLSPLQTQQVYDCRRNIAYGMAMEVTEEGEVYVRCLSTRPLYVESHYLDREAMRVSGDVSHVVYQQAAIKVYDLWQSFQLMCFWITQRKLLSKQNNSSSSLKKLTVHLSRLCKFRVSFGVDWGTKQRPSISDTPCWVEVNMSRAKNLVDRLLERPEIAYNFVFNNAQNGKQIPPKGLLSP